MVTMTITAQSLDSSVDTKLMEVFFFIKNKQIKDATIELEQFLKHPSLSYSQDSLCARAWHQIGGQYNRNKNYKQALNAYHQSLKIRKKTFTSIHPDIALSYNMIGSVHLKSSNYEPALPFLKKALKIYIALKDNDVAYVHFDLGIVYEKQGDYQTAIRHFRKAILFFEKKAKKRNIANSYIFIGNCYANLKQYALAKTNFEQALNMHQQLSNTQGIQQTLNNLGNINLYSKDYQSALNYYHTALELNLQNKDSLEIANNYSNIGIVYTHLNQYQKALEYHQLALMYRATLDSSQRDKALAISYNNMADVYQHKKEFNKALRYYQNAIIATSSNFRDSLFSVNPTDVQIKKSPYKTDLLGYITDKAKCLKKMGKQHAALNTFHAADQVIDFMRAEHTTEASKLFWRKTTHPTYEAALEICYELQNFKQAFYFMEKSRAALLLDQLKYYKGAEDNLVPPTEEELYQSLLQENKADFVAFFVGEKSIFILKPDLEQTVFLKLKKTPALDSSIQNFIQNIKKPNLDFENYISQAHFLYQQMIAPLNLKHKRLFLIRDGYLNYLPFETLITQKAGHYHAANQSYLGFEYSISYDYSAAIALENFQKKTDTSIHFFAIAPNHFPEFKLPDLNSHPLLQQLRQYFASSTILQDAAATKTAFINQIPHFNVINLITHASSKDDFPRIYFRDDSLTLPELYQLKLQADLVVLTACETGIGELQEGEGVMSLSRGFAYSGIPSTVTTLWSANEQTTYQIIERFYDYLSQKMPKDKALQQAKMDYLKTCSSFSSSPYYWATLTCVGDIQPLSFSRTYLWYWLAFGFIVSLFLLKRLASSRP